MKRSNIFNSTYLLILLLVIMTGACKKTDENLDRDIPGLGGDNWVTTPLDTWLYDNFTKPYNFAVKYKWERFELEPTKTMTPPKEEKVMPVMNLIKELWMDAYIELAGTNFFNTYSPKEYVLVGSYEYNSNGTVKEGSAEGGRKITLYNLNTFLPSNKPVAKRMIHVIQHEFGHILHQNKMYPASFKMITPGDYTSDWNNRSEGFQEKGIITQYAQSNPDDDFVELIAFMLTEGKEAFESLLANPDIPESAVTKFRMKENIVVEYFKSSWDIDFYALQALMTEKSKTYFDRVPIKELIDAQVITTLTVFPDEENQSAAFQSALETTAQDLYDASPDKYLIAGFEYTFDSETSILFSTYIYPEDDVDDMFAVNYLLIFQNNPDGTKELVNISTNTTGQNFAPILAPVLFFFDGVKMKIDFDPVGKFGSATLLGRFFDATDPAYYIKGTFDENYGDNN